MIKNFSDTAEAHLKAIIKSVEPKGFFERVADFFGDIGLYISGLWGNLDISNYVGNIDEYYRKTFDKRDFTIGQLESIFEKVRDDDTLYSVKLTRNVIEDNCSLVSQYITKLSDIINPDNGKFSSECMMFSLAPLGLLLRQTINNIINPSYVTEDGEHFGGNQGSAYQRWIQGDKSEIRKIVKKYHPNYSDAQIQDFLDNMNSEGCAYMANVNTLFAIYNGRETEFEEKFGFPMYDKNGNPNWDLVMIDYYSSEDNPYTKGLNRETSENTWEHYLGNKGIEVDVVKLNDVTTENFYEKAENGEIIAGMSPLRLRDKEGRLVDDRDAGHAVVITDVVEVNGKKMFKVSSWGKDYYVDPDDFSIGMRLDYQQNRYKVG